MTKKILVVEDEAFLSLNLKNMLEALGYSVTALCVSGEDAIQLAAEAKPDLVLMDIVLKGEMDGVQAAKYIQGEFDIPVVYLTALSDEETLQRARVTLPFGYLLKPCKERELHSTIEMALYKHEMEKALRKSEARYRGLFDGVPVGLNRTTPKGEILDANSAMVKIFGYPDRETFLGINAFDIYADPEDRRRWQALIEREGTVRNYTMKLRRHDGSIIWGQSNARAVKDADGRVLHYEESLEDITERKQTELELSQQAEEFATLYATGLDVATPHKLPDLLEKIVERAAMLLDCASGELYLCDPERKTARCVVSFNTPSDNSGTVLNYGEGAAGTVAETGEALIFDDYRTWDNRAVIFEEDQPFYSLISVPIVWQDQVIGVLHVLNHHHQRLFNSSDLHLIEMFANQAAIAIENARLLDQAHQEIAERKQVERRLEYLATHDPLTDLPNRSLFYDRLDHALSLANRERLQVAVMFLDLDGFKSVNDAFGHAKGDRLLKKVAARLADVVRGSDTVARLSGDEFALILEKIQDAKDADVIARKILEVLSKPFRLDEHEFVVTTSIGISLYPQNGGDANGLLKQADAAMYDVKTAGKNNFQFAT